jgi:hypothetical protein
MHHTLERRKRRGKGRKEDPCNTLLKKKKGGKETRG